MVSCQSAPLYSGIRELLYSLKSKNNIKYCALSNACSGYVRRVIQENSLDDIFSVYLGADEVPKEKPFADGLLTLCQMVDLLPSECVFIGDSPTGFFYLFYILFNNYFNYLIRRTSCYEL